MATSKLINTKATNWKPTPFVSSYDGERGEVVCDGGFVIPIESNQNDFLVKSKIVSSESREAYLRVKVKPFTNQIENAETLSVEEVIEKREESDDLLNVYVPIGVFAEDGERLNPNLIRDSLNFMRSRERERLSCYFDDGKVYISGFVFLSDGSTIIEVCLDQTLDATEGQIILFNINANINFVEFDDPEKNDYGNLILNSYGFSATSGLLTYSNSVFEDNDESRQFNFVINYPIGFIEDGNFITLDKGNIRVRVDSTFLLTFFEGIEVSETGCQSPNYTTETFLAIYLDF